MKTLLILGWLGTLLLAAFLRFEQLGSRPVHADEATGARITAHRMEGHYRFDPGHFHGPSLSACGAVAARAGGAAAWAELERRPLRAVTAAAGVLLVLVPWLGRHRFGHAPMLLAALFLASSPLLVYYSRMYIHEMLLALFAALALATAARARALWIAGACIGLMFATKETFVISLAGWLLAAAAVVALEPGGPRRAIDWANTRVRPIAIAALVAILVPLFAYTDGFRQWSGAVDAVRTYFVYDLVDGHEKPFGYYIRLMGWPHFSGGLRWFETPLLLAALAGAAAGFGKPAREPAIRVACRFLALATALHFLAYSLIGYKTPWLAVVPWTHAAILAGFSACWLRDAGKARLAPVAAALLAAAGIGLQYLQARQATGIHASDGRNPYAYVPTSPDLEELEPWLRSILEHGPGPERTAIAVVGPEYWPLPWYLRHFPLVGYWSESPGSLERFPVLCDTGELELFDSHVPVPRGLRDGVPMTVWVRHDLWEASR